MIEDAWIKAIDSEWDLEGEAFLYQVRQGHFDPAGLERILKKLRAISIEPSATELPRRLVEVLWFMPQFMEWQRDRVRKKGTDPHTYDVAVILVRNEIERILGLP